MHTAHLRGTKRIRHHVDTLMELLPTLRHVCEMSQLPQIEDVIPMQPMKTSVETAAHPFVRQVHDKFPRVDAKLADRPGEANWQRFDRLQELQSGPNLENTGANQIAQPCQSKFIPVSEFQDSGLGSSLRVQSQSAASAASHSSFLTTKSSAHGGPVHVPPTPAEVDLKQSFDCQICRETSSDIKSRVEWK